ncbi:MULTISPECIES: cupin domain-containing protein [unclassified Nodularia (in: cyanobacteria)]|uniref:cupin domain-containing protein n=1 Tax=unclassified Nodularia (in: cyanobacteria) TaxID=2656917 RepID=UPI0018827351|nr:MULTISPECIES: cupin domain-containing protein [unclassified Nodularia (in: cyanobacteria)]MBE9199953.1 cupin domain-containing protein [Nodularia sp. LEGE 06071]MCC2695698.1 cupin domain-containing protein [Nodularia sp. LEGE 04288]
MIINPENVPRRTTSIYPDKFKSVVFGRVKQALGNAAGLKNFGVNLVTLAPGSCSALRHWHTRQDEFIYVIEGEVTLVTDGSAQILTPGMMAGFPAGEEDGHQLVNRSHVDVVYLEIGDRTPNDEAYYPDHDLIAKPGADGHIVFTHQDGSLYES